jgi:D-3-phosphoglycerate dehydrogenase
MKILICDPLSPESIEELRTTGKFTIDVALDLDESSLAAAVPPYHCMVVRGRTKVTRKVLEAAGELELIVRGGAGIDNIDVEAATARGVTVLNTPGANAESVGEMAIGFLLCLARQIPQAHAGLAAGRWEKKKLRGSEIYGKTLGIIGVGRTGKSVSRKARALGMSVLGYDPYVSEEEIIEARAVPAPLEELLRAADYITFHVPLTPETSHMADADFFAAAKEGVRILNLARGGVIDEEALLRAIESGKVAGAALDVFSEEPPGSNPLLEKECVIATPHIGGATVEAQERVGRQVAKVIMEYAAGEYAREEGPRIVPGRPEK